MPTLTPQNLSDLEIAAQRGCLKCVYHEQKKDGHTRCVNSDRFRDIKATDCYIPEEELRDKQMHARNVEEYAYITHTYITKYKLQSKYWLSQERKHKYDD